MATFSCTPATFSARARAARFYPLLYLLTRVGRAKDWASGVELTMYLLGKFSRLEVHHIFPKALLYDHGYERAEVNAIANFTFLTQDTNLKVSNRDPAAYLEEFVSGHPGVIESHWIPTDRRLWRVENYPEFLAARRKLLAKAANETLDGLLAGAVPEPVAAVAIAVREVAVMPGGVADEAEEEALLACNDWVIGKGLPEGELLHELVDPLTGEPLAILDLAWPDGLQPGLSEPVALLIDETVATHAAANEAGFRFFTNVDSFESYVEREVLALDQDERPAA